jgi:hypothetical protein
MEKGITEAEYQKNTNSFFENKKGTLLRTYKNVSGQKIKRNSLIIIIEKLQKVRFGDTILINCFYVQDVNTGIEIGGVKASDIDLCQSNEQS